MAWWLCRWLWLWLWLWSGFGTSQEGDDESLLRSANAGGPEDPHRPAAATKYGAGAAVATISRTEIERSTGNREAGNQNPARAASTFNQYLYFGRSSLTHRVTSSPLLTRNPLTLTNSQYIGKATLKYCSHANFNTSHGPRQ